MTRGKIRAMVVRRCEEFGSGGGFAVWWVNWGRKRDSSRFSRLVKSGDLIGGLSTSRLLFMVSTEHFGNTMRMYILNLLSQFVMSLSCLLLTHRHSYEMSIRAWWRMILARGDLRKYETKRIFIQAIKEAYQRRQKYTIIVAPISTTRRILCCLVYIWQVR